VNTQSTLFQKHNLISETGFRIKVALFVIKRSLANATVAHIPAFKNENKLNDSPIISSSQSELWNADDSESNWILTAGKIENLRIAAQKLNGLEVKAGNIFSFWKHVGAPLSSRGFVIGREIREGCIVPTVAGGLCQLSNALYDAALGAGFEIIERHRHTKVIKGSLAEHDRDATVKWNYIDLRFKPNCDFKIVIDFTPQKLIVSFKGIKTNSIVQPGKHITSASKLNDCYSCGNTGCFKHPGETVLNTQKQTTTFILDENWPEYDGYIKSTANQQDFFIVPFTPNQRFKIPRYSWDIQKRLHRIYSLTAFKRALAIRFAGKFKGNIPSAYLKYDSHIVNSFKKSIPLTTTHIVIAQNLLPFAWQHGLLWGRTFDILMTRLPMELLQQQLDDAHLTHTYSKTLNDFRADKDLVELENLALTKARHIITPHQHIADIFNNKSIKLNWVQPQLQPVDNLGGNKVLFPASALARKGAYEIKKLAVELNLDLVVLGHATETDNFWQDVNVSFTQTNIFKDVKLVILPAYIEHQPRLLLKALALNIPVVATPACGIQPTENLTIVPVGNYDALKNAVQNIYMAREVEIA